MSNEYAIIYMCRKCPGMFVRRSGGLYTAQIPTHCGLGMITKEISHDEPIGLCTETQIDALLGAGYMLYFSGSTAALYTITKGKEEEYKYHLNISNETLTSVYHESYRVIRQLTDHEPFDLSKFRIEYSKV